MPNWPFTGLVSRICVRASAGGLFCLDWTQEMSESVCCEVGPVASGSIRGCFPPVSESANCWWHGLVSKPTALVRLRPSPFNRSPKLVIVQD